MRHGEGSREKEQPHDDEEEEHREEGKAGVPALMPRCDDTVDVRRRRARVLLVAGPPRRGMHACNLWGYAYTSQASLMNSQTWRASLSGR